MKKEDLTLYSNEFDKFRVGRSNDGGYILVDIPGVKYDLFLSAGIANDCSFEEDFCNRFNVNCYAFDGTINGLYTTNSNIKFIQKNIGLVDSDTETTLIEYIENNNNIFLKIDIEGAEVPWLDMLSNEQINKFNQMVIEFHFYEPPYYHNFYKCDVFQKLNKTHTLLHFHSNNCCGVEEYENTNFPRVFECTFVNKKLLNKVTVNERNLPTDLDMVNLGGGDILIDYPPFVNKN